jgi:serine/threonine protein kinase
LFLQLFSALKYCHKNGCINRDIKPSNILLTRDFQIKLIDFGISKNIEESGNLANILSGTPIYMAR